MKTPFMLELSFAEVLWICERFDSPPIIDHSDAFWQSRGMRVIDALWVVQNAGVIEHYGDFYGLVRQATEVIEARMGE